MRYKPNEIEIDIGQKTTFDCLSSEHVKYLNYLSFVQIRERIRDLFEIDKLDWFNSLNWVDFGKRVTLFWYFASQIVLFEPQFANEVFVMCVLCDCRVKKTFAERV